MNKKILLILLSIILFCFIFITSFLWYRFFYHHGKKEIAVLQVNLGTDDAATIDLDNVLPNNDDDIENITPYEFVVNNDSRKNGLYRVLIEDVALNDDPIYQSKNLLSRRQLNYQLLLNNKIIKQGKLSEIKNNILDERSIDANKKNQYHLRVYVNQDAVYTNWQNKYYHYKINVQILEESK